MEKRKKGVIFGIIRIFFCCDFQLKTKIFFISINSEDYCLNNLPNDGFYVSAKGNEKGDSISSFLENSYTCIPERYGNRFCCVFQITSRHDNSIFCILCHFAAGEKCYSDVTNL